MEHYCEKPPRRRHLPGMTLVEVMVAMAVFAIAIIGVIGVFIFSLRTQDASRSMTQVTQILTHEMEAMRIRGWQDRKPVLGNDKWLVHGLHSLGSGKSTDGSALVAPGNNGVKMETTDTKTTTGFTPFAVYGVPMSSADKVARLGMEVPFAVSDLQTQYRNANGTASGYQCTRTVELFTTKAGTEYAEVALTVKWTDSRGVSHSRSLSSTMSANGLNQFVYNAVPQNASIP